MIKCFIIDDERSSIDVLKKYIEDTPSLSVSGTETNPINALNLISTRKVSTDIAFLDINMPGLLGIDLALQIRAFCKIVFTTIHADYGVKAFDIEAFDFLLKPFSYERFLQTVRRLNSVEGVAQSKDDFLFIKGNKKGVLQRLETDAILFIESSHNYCIIHLMDLSKQTVYLSLTEMEDALPQGKFLRIQKSYIINIRRITKIEGLNIFLQNKVEPLNCGRDYKPALLAAINNRILFHKE